MVECYYKWITENGGKVVNPESKANYVVQEDGYQADVWSCNDGRIVDDLNRNIVHPRWIQSCIELRKVIQHDSLLHLVPLPVKIPQRGLASIMSVKDKKEHFPELAEEPEGSIAFTLLTTEQDKITFKGLCENSLVQNKFQE